MTEITSKYADFESLRAQAAALRRAGLSRSRIRDRLHIDNNDILNRLVRDEPAPEWTKRPNAKDDLREKARELRLQVMTSSASRRCLLVPPHRGLVVRHSFRRQHPASER